MSKSNVWNEVVFPVSGLVLVFLVCVFILGLTMDHFSQDSPVITPTNNTTFVMIVDSALATSVDLSALQDRYLDPQASCYVIANDTLSAIIEAINKMKNVDVIHKFTQVNDTLYYMQLEKIKEPNED